jgi:hypothetical protein
VLHDSIKESTEETVASAFVQHLATLGVTTQSRRRGEPDKNEPDFMCTDGNAKPFGIEITSGYYSGTDAAQLRAIVTDLARQGKRQTVMSTSGIDDTDLPPGVIRNPDAKLATNLQIAMESHCLKHYGIPTYLVLDGSWAPLTSAEDAPVILAGLAKPATSPYTDVFLCLVRNYSASRIFFRLP